jgi:LmbE family N-acetylglucosaminyl deacetylase
MADIALAVLAHPDDAEFLCAGALIRLKQEHGWEIHIATMTPGDCGSAELGPEEISRMRRQEGANAAAVIGGVYHCLEERDLRVFYNETVVAKVTRLLRTVRPRMLFTHSPSDYMLDHEMTSQVVRAAAFNAPIPNFLPEDKTPRLEHIPTLYYCDPIEGMDPLGNKIRPGFCVDIATVMQTKVDMLACHASQREWLLKHHGMDQYLKAVQDWGRERGQSCGVEFAEGYRQHLGHSYPRENLLGSLLGVKWFQGST